MENPYAIMFGVVVIIVGLMLIASGISSKGKLVWKQGDQPPSFKED